MPAVKKVMGSIPVGAHARSNLKMASLFEIFINDSYHFKNDNNNSNINIIIIIIIIYNNNKKKKKGQAGLP